MSSEPTSEKMVVAYIEASIPILSDDALVKAADMIHKEAKKRRKNLKS